jgi:molybdopterin-guanine dinucleotide biosynthesis protein A
MVSAILAGGENTRFPAQKAFIEIEGRRLIERTIETLQGLFPEVLISTNRPEEFFYLGLPMIGDVYDVRGPLTGIFSVLYASGAERVFVLACDMPFPNPELIKALRDTDGPAVVPLWRGRPQPLLGHYGRQLLPEMERRILQGRVGLRDFLRETGAVFVPEAEVSALDPQGLSFLNINTPEDLKRVLDTVRR